MVISLFKASQFPLFKRDGEERLTSYFLKKKNIFNSFFSVNSDGMKIISLHDDECILTSQCQAAVLTANV